MFEYKYGKQNGICNVENVIRNNERTGGYPLSYVKSPSCQVSSLKMHSLLACRNCGMIFLKICITSTKYIH